MESPMLKMLKSQNPDKEYPSNVGQKWTNEEEILLLEELDKNMDIALIAMRHNRTIGGINSRRREIAYKMYSNNISMEEIIFKTKLDKDQIIEIIKKRQNISKKCKPFSVENEIKEMRNEIKELRKSIKELVEMMKAIYEFEEA